MKVQGQAVSRTYQLLSASVTKEVNRVASARLVYLDGAASKSDFPLSNAGTFVPGSEVEILAGPPEKPISIFKGVVVAEALKIRDSAGPQLVVECRHKAFKLTVGRKNACFFKEADSDVISGILGAAGVGADVEATSVVHPQLVQLRATDWDFLLTRAEANGKLVFTNDDQVAVKAPAMGTSSVTLLFGATILELDALVDARLQWSGVKGMTWDPAQQAVVSRDAKDPGVAGPGNLQSSDLASVAGLPALELRHASLEEDEAQAWADAEWLKSRLSKVSGRVKCEGIATVNPGDTVTLGGVGDRFNGDVFVTAVRHDNNPAHGFKTHIQFGSVERWLADDHHHVAAPKAGALLPSISGLTIGTVTSNEDPDNEDRVRVRLPLVDAGDGVWARVANLDAGNQRGFFFRPEIGDEVVVGFLDDDPRRAVLLGMLNSSKNPAPIKGSDQNDQKAYQSRSKMKLSFDDGQKIVSLETPAGNKITLSEADKGVKIEDQNGNSITLDPNGITLDTQKALKLSGGTDGAEINSTGTTALKGLKVKLN